MKPNRSDGRALPLSRTILLEIKPLESCWWCGSAWYKRFKIAKLTLCLSQQFQWLTVLSPRQFTDDNGKRLSLLQFAAPTAVICFCLDIHNSRNTTNCWHSYFSYCFQHQCLFYYCLHHHRRFISPERRSSCGLSEFRWSCVFPLGFWGYFLNLL